MGEIITICLFLAGGLGVALARVFRRRQRIETRTREWIEFLQQDLSASSL
jgi:hypothetical protein